MIHTWCICLYPTAHNFFQLYYSLCHMIQFSKIRCLFLFICSFLTLIHWVGSSWAWWAWLCGSWIFHYTYCIQSMLITTDVVSSNLDQGTTLCDKVCQWFSRGTLVSSTNKTDRHDITGILLIVTINSIKQTNNIHCTLKIKSYTPESITM